MIPAPPGGFTVHLELERDGRTWSHAATVVAFNDDGDPLIIDHAHYNCGLVTPNDVGAARWRLEDNRQAAATPAEPGLGRGIRRAPQRERQHHRPCTRPRMARLARRIRWQRHRARRRRRRPPHATRRHRLRREPRERLRPARAYHHPNATPSPAWPTQQHAYATNITRPRTAARRPHDHAGTGLASMLRQTNGGHPCPFAPTRVVFSGLVDQKWPLVHRSSITTNRKEAA